MTTPITGILPREIVELIIQFYNRDDSDSVVLRAVSRVFKELVPQPVEKYYRPDVSDFVSSISRLEWAIENGGLSWMNKSPSILACRRGNLEVLKWLRSKGHLKSPWLCTIATQEGHLGVLKWLRQEGYPLYEMTCAFAAKHGRLKILKWLRSQGCPWDVSTCTVAAQMGHLEVLKWARENGCPWDAWTYVSSSRNEVVSKWLRDNGCPQA